MKPRTRNREPGTKHVPFGGDPSGRIQTKNQELSGPTRTCPDAPSSVRMNLNIASKLSCLIDLGPTDYESEE